MTNIMSELKIAHDLNDHQSAMFLHLLGENYHRIADQPLYGRLAVVDFEGKRYVARTDGYTCLFFKVPDTLPLGDYRDVPYMVKMDDDDTWSKSVRKLLDIAKEQTTYPYYENDNVEMVVNVDLASHGLGPSVMSASISDGKLLVDMEKPHVAIFDRERYEFIFDAVGPFNTVRYSKPNRQIVFMSKHTDNFAILMPMHPEATLTKAS